MRGQVRRCLCGAPLCAVAYVRSRIAIQRSIQNCSTVMYGVWLFTNIEENNEASRRCARELHSVPCSRGWRRSKIYMTDNGCGWDSISYSASWYTTAGGGILNFTRSSRRQRGARLSRYCRTAFEYCIPGMKLESRPEYFRRDSWGSCSIFSRFWMKSKMQKDRRS